MKIFRAIISHVVVDVTSTPFREPANMNIAITRTTHRTTHAPTRPSPDLRRCLSAKARHSLSATGFATAALLAIVRSAISNQLSRERAHTNLTRALLRCYKSKQRCWKSYFHNKIRLIGPTVSFYFSLCYLASSDSFTIASTTAAAVHGNRDGDQLTWLAQYEHAEVVLVRLLLYLLALLYRLRRVGISSRLSPNPCSMHVCACLSVFVDRTHLSLNRKLWTT